MAAAIKAILDDPKCGAFFGSAFFPLGNVAAPLAAAGLAGANVTTTNGPSQISYDPNAGPTGTITQPVVANTSQGTGIGSTININMNGAFFKGTAFFTSSGGPGGQIAGPLTVGPYSGNTLQAQVTTILHEYAHNLNLIPADARGPNTPANQSNINTSAIVSNCGAGINAAGH